jgi:hypothetical protein
MDGGHAEGFASGVGPSDIRFGFDLFDQSRDLVPVGFRSQVLPAGERGERDSFGRSVFQALVGLAPAAGGVLLGAIEPEAFEISAVQQGSDGVDPGPVAQLRDEVFLDAVGEQVAEAVDLGGLLGADDDRLVAPGPDLLPPAGEAADFPCQVGIEMAMNLARCWASSTSSSRWKWVDRKVKAQIRTGFSLWARPRTPRTISLSARLGRSRSRPWRSSAGDLDQGTAVRGCSGVFGSYPGIRRKTGPKSLRCPSSLSLRGGLVSFDGFRRVILFLGRALLCSAGTRSWQVGRA